MSDAAPLDPAVAETLARLRDYRLPEPVGWWPPAPGWWLLGLVVLVALAVAAVWITRRRRRRAAARAAARELTHLRTAYDADRDAGALLRRLSTLLRRFALAQWPRDQVAGLNGDAWLAFLDLHGGDGQFRDGPGRCLADGPYRRDADVPVDELLHLVDRWLGRQARARR
jgi:hypothetical protein